MQSVPTPIVVSTTGGSPVEVTGRVGRAGAPYEAAGCGLIVLGLVVGVLFGMLSPAIGGTIGIAFVAVGFVLAVIGRFK